MVSRHLPDEALSPELAVEFWIEAFTTMVNVKALAALLAESCVMFLADSNRPSSRMILTVHLFFLLVLIINETSIQGQKEICFLIHERISLVLFKIPLFKQGP